ncbi:hypothetical protein DAPPUDRAFT_243004 [Daphnia pulex]|uniref:Uncharacterized protein n=1 Tax=Daphnia pulex TaxID=6669 RepID=E9GHW3_DAPPU|nr:hypothetical protein DAPPUDRAFT_243004 [Daphnia pulex]|eukprot:EFX80906.1 hypothetical protein DAPPUDRAFT_243004 [Daphnia pulex]
MDYFRFSTHLDGPAAGGIISLLLIASIISQPVVISARSQVNVMPYASGRAGPFETCVNVTSGEEGRCMFAMDCFRARGRHVGICTKGFYFGSCCTLPTYSSSTADPPLIIRPPSAVSSSPVKEPLPPTADNLLPRVPIGVLESNDIDGPEAGRPPFDPLDLSYWPDLLADIYALKPQQPMTLPKFPYSTFHAPSISSSSSSHGNAASSSTVSPVVVSPGSIGPAAVNATTPSNSIPPTTTPSSTVMTTVTTATTTKTTTTLKTPSSSSSPSTTTTSVPTTTTTTTTSSSTFSC